MIVELVDIQFPFRPGAAFTFAIIAVDHCGLKSKYEMTGSFSGKSIKCISNLALLYHTQVIILPRVQHQPPLKVCFHCSMYQCIPSTLDGNLYL